MSSEFSPWRTLVGGPLLYNREAGMPFKQNTV